VRVASDLRQVGLDLGADVLDVERAGEPRKLELAPGSSVTDASFESSAMGCPFSLCLCCVPRPSARSRRAALGSAGAMVRHRLVPGRRTPIFSCFDADQLSESAGARHL